LSDAELWTAFRVGLAIAAVVVVIAASLLIAIWVVARAILAHAVRALQAAEKIRSNTLPIWELQSTNDTAERILEAVQSIEAKGGALVAAIGAAEEKVRGKSA